MSNKKCKSCLSEIDEKASKCPKCGTDQRNWFMKHKVVTGVIAIIIFFIVIGSAGGSKNGTSSNTSSKNTVTTQATVTPKPAPIVVDALSLIKEYDKNKLSAQDKYTGKTVQTTAFIKNISSDIAGTYYLSLNPSNDQYYFGTTIACYFGSDKSQLTSLENGQSVTVQGAMQDMSLGILVMKDCSLVK